MTLTALEIQGIAGIINSDYRDGYHPVGRPVWTWSANKFNNRAIYSGVVSSLVKKGLVHSEGHSEEDCITLLQAGLDAYEKAIGKKWDDS